MDDHVRAPAGIECRNDAAVIDETPMASKDIDVVMAAHSCRAYDIPNEASTRSISGLVSASRNTGVITMIASCSLPYGTT